MATLSNDGTSTGPHRRRRFVREDREIPSDVTTIAQITEWVGEDRTRAQAALDAETAKDVPRVTLVEHLEGVLTAPEQPVVLDSSTADAGEAKEQPEDDG